MKASLQRMVLSTAETLGLFDWARRRHQNELLVLTYHSVVQGVDRQRQQYPLVYRNAVSAEHFEQQMLYLRRHYQPLDRKDLLEVLEGKSFPTGAVAITFDDGLVNNATVALPILKRLGIPAFFFLPTGFVDDASRGKIRRHWTEDLIARMSHKLNIDAVDLSALEDELPALQENLDARAPSESTRRVVDHLKSLSRTERLDRLSGLIAVLGDPPPLSTFPADPHGHSILASMTWNQARRAAENGITLGGHTVNHESLAQLPDDEAASEITECLRDLSEHTEQQGEFFSYPYGRACDFTDVHQDVLADLGCRAAFTQIVGFNDSSTNPLTLRRIDVSSDYSLNMFSYVATGTKKAVDNVIRRRTSSPS